MGIYRLWRDGGFAIGALLAGVVADAIPIPAAIYAVAALTAASGLVAAHRMYEAHPKTGTDQSLDFILLHTFRLYPHRRTNGPSSVAPPMNGAPCGSWHAKGG